MTERTSTTRRRLLRFGLGAVATLVVTALGLELGMRWLLFGESALAQRLGADLRRPTRFAARWEDEHWRLHHALLGLPHVTGQADPVVGWRSNVIRPGTFVHRGRERLDGRRPVLMYGDSFTFCVTPEEECWQGLLERSERGAELCLVNYGVGGYGLDQIFVLLRHSIERWTKLDPIVIVGILVDDDLDRCMLRARTGPKPWFSLAPDGALVEHPPELVDPPPTEPPAPGIASYLWRYLAHGADWLPDGLGRWLRGEARHARATQALCARMLAELHAELDALGLQHFVVLFHTDVHLASEPLDDWRDAWLESELARLGLPYVSSRRALAADMRASGDAPSAYFVPMGEKGQNHLNARGNAVVFGAILRGLDGRYDDASAAR